MVKEFDGKKYKAERKALGLTQETIYIRTGIHANKVSRYETGKQKPRSENRKRLEDGLYE